MKTQHLFLLMTAVLTLPVISCNKWLPGGDDGDPLPEEGGPGHLNDDFSTGETFGWSAVTAGASSELVDGQLVITLSENFRGDFGKEGGTVLHAGDYPIVAVRFNKPPKCNFFFDTNLGSYNNRNNNHTKIPLDNGNVYYWDLSSGTLGTTALPQDEPTEVSTFQFKVAEVELTQEQIDEGDLDYEIDWVRTYPSVNALRSAVGAELPGPFEYSGTFSHPGLLHSMEDLDRIKALAASQSGRPYDSYQLLLDNSRSSASYNMGGPFTRLTRDPSQTVDGVPGGTVKARVENDFLAAYYNALMWYITEDEAHALKSVEILDAYAATTTGIVGGDAELNGLYGFILANAAEIMRYTYSAWPQENIQQCQTMLQSVFYPVLENFRPCAHGNWDHACMEALMAIAIFSDDVDMFNHVVTYFYHGEGNGPIDNYVLTPAGQLQESNRDQPHTMLALGNLAELAEMAWKQGVDLYEASDNAIMRGYEYTSRYNLGKEVDYQTSYDFCERNYPDYTPEVISTNGRGNFRSVFEIAYNHYVYRKGLAMPETLEVLQAIGPEDAPFGADHPGYGSLLFYLNESPDH